MENMNQNNNDNKSLQKMARNPMSAHEILSEWAPQTIGGVSQKAWSDFPAFLPRRNRGKSKNLASNYKLHHCTSNYEDLTGKIKLCFTAMQYIGNKCVVRARQLRI